MTRAAILALALAGCVGDDGTGPPTLLDASACDACPDARADAPADARDGGGLEIDAVDAADAGGGLPVNAACEPLLEQCAGGLTCRIRAAHDGVCQGVGELAPGAICAGVDQCGANAACIPAAGGVMRCRVVCAVAAPARCTGGEACIAFWGPDTGVCL